MKEQTPDGRMIQLQDRTARIADEIEAIGDDEQAHKTVVNGEEFDNLEWLLAESKAIDGEVSGVLSVMTPDGEIPYEEGYNELP